MPTQREKDADKGMDTDLLILHSMTDVVTGFLESFFFTNSEIRSRLHDQYPVKSFEEFRTTGQQFAKASMKVLFCAYLFEKHELSHTEQVKIWALVDKGTGDSGFNSTPKSKLVGETIGQRPGGYLGGAIAATLLVDLVRETSE